MPGIGIGMASNVGSYSMPRAADLQNAAWYIDGANSTGLASDLNNGYTATTPLKTKRELSKRLSGGILQQVTKVYLMSSEAAGDDGAMTCSVALFPIIFYGTKTQVSTTSTISTAGAGTVPASGATGGTLKSITDSTRTNAFFTTYATAEYIIENVTHPAWFCVIADLGSKNCSIATPLTDADPADYYSFAGNDPFLASAVSNVNGDTYKIWKLPKHTFSSLLCPGVGGLYVGMSFKNVYVQDISATLGSAAGTQVEMAFCNFVQCGIAANLISHPANGSALFFNCRNDASYTVLSGFTPYVGGYAANIITAQTGGRISFGGDAVLKGTVAVGGGCLNHAACWIDTSHAIANSEGAIGSMTMVDDAILTTALRMYGPGTIKGSNGAVLSFATSAASSYRVTGGVSLDGGQNIYGIIPSTGVWTPPLSSTISHIDTAAGATGVGSYGRTLFGTKVGLYHS